MGHTVVGVCEAPYLKHLACHGTMISYLLFSAHVYLAWYAVMHTAYTQVQGVTIPRLMILRFEL